MILVWCWEISKSIEKEFHYLRYFKWKNKFTITVSHNNYNSYLLYHADFGIISLVGNVIFHHIKWGKYRFILFVSVGGVLDILQQNKLLNISYDQHIKNDMLPSSNGGKEVSPSCVKVYLNEFSQDDKISTKKKVSRKTVLRIASENSLRSTTSYMMTIAT